MPFCIPSSTEHERRRRQDTLEKVRQSILLVRDLSASSPLPVAPLFSILHNVTVLAATALSNEEVCVDLAERSAGLVTAIINETTGQKIELTPQLRHDIGTLTGTLQSVLEYIEKQQKRSFIRRLWTAQDDASDVKALHGQIDRVLEAFQLKAQIAVHQKLEFVKQAIDRDYQAMKETAAGGIATLFDMQIRLLPPAPSIFFGRQETLEELINVVTAKDEQPARVAILGPGGVGKTSLALALLHSVTVQAVFGSRRFFVRCDAATSPDGLVSAIAAELNITGGDLLTRIRQILLADSGRRNILVLDNFESPWEPEKARSVVEEMLAQLAGIQSLVLIITLRGLERPAGIQWTRPFFAPLQPLDPASAHSTFRAISDIDDEGVSELLSKIDNLPLAITLMANLAQFETTGSLLKRWETDHVTMLARGSANRLTSMEVSIQVSLESPRVRENPDALPLLSLLSLLPDGIEDQTQFDAITSSFKNAGRAASTLKQVSLAYSTDTRYLAVLAPIRLYLLHHQVKPALSHRQALLRYYLELASQASSLEVNTNGQAIIRLLANEVGNLQAILISAISDDALRSDPELSKRIIQAAIDTTDLYRYTGLGDTGPLTAATTAARLEGFNDLEAQCFLKEGELLYSRSKRDLANVAFRQALRLFKAGGQLSGQSRCSLMLGMIESQAGNHKVAEEHERLALGLARAANDDNAVADCLLRLAQSFAWTGKYDQAKEHVTTALTTYTKLSHIRAQARCQWLMGFIEYESHGDYDVALELLNVALTKYRTVGDPTGGANCLRILGRLSLARVEFAEANEFLRQAIQAYEAVKWTYGLADCNQALGEVSVAVHDDEAASKSFHRALELYKEINHQSGEMFCQKALEDIALRQK